MNSMHLVIGTGPLGRYTAEALLKSGHRVRLINRSGVMPFPPKGAEVIKADLYEINSQSVLFKGVSTLYQCAQPAYHRWKKEFPALQQKLVTLASENNLALVAAENLYMYGRTQGKPMDENTANNPCSVKGRIRMQMSDALFDAARQGRIQVASVRGSNFFGPWEPVLGKIMFRAALNNKTVWLPGKLELPHSFTYTRDFGEALAVAGTDERALGRIWHVPSGNPCTQQQLVDMISAGLGRQVKVRAIGRFLLSMLGIFDRNAGEASEMLYEFNEPYILNAAAMEKTFGLKATPMEQRIEETLDWVRRQIQ